MSLHFLYAHSRGGLSSFGLAQKTDKTSRQKLSQWLMKLTLSSKCKFFSPNKAAVIYFQVIKNVKSFQEAKARN
jgi:hypothetical protein